MSSDATLRGKKASTLLRKPTFDSELMVVLVVPLVLLVPVLFLLFCDIFKAAQAREPEMSRQKK